MKANPVLLSYKKLVDIRQKELDLLQPGEWLNDNVITFFGLHSLDQSSENIKVIDAAVVRCII